MQSQYSYATPYSMPTGTNLLKALMLPELLPCSFQHLLTATEVAKSFDLQPTPPTALLPIAPPVRRSRA